MEKCNRMCVRKTPPTPKKTTEKIKETKQPPPRMLIIFTGEGDINDVLIKTLAEAHSNTNLKLDIVHEMLRKNQVRNTCGQWKIISILWDTYPYEHIT